MRDMPFFQTENGIASLILKEIVYKKIAYIRIQSALQLDALLKECIDFCRAVGAEQIFATGVDSLTQYPLSTSIVEMTCSKTNIPRSDLLCLPADVNSYEQWRTIYNNRMRNIPNAATITIQDIEKQMPGSFFVYENETLIGIGKVSEIQIDAIVAVVKGAGKKVLSALASKIAGDRVLVEVATTNTPAMRLYSSMNFTVTKKISDWYQVY